MSTKITAALWVTIVITFVAIQFMMADISPQHAEFLRTFLWDFPCILLERIVPWYGS
jgi:hypothetical protein